MIKLLLLSILAQTLLLAHPVENALNWVDNEYKKFRTYPRIDRAYKYIKKGEDKEAQKLFEKVLEIDPLNKEASTPLISLCLKNNDKACIKKNISYLKDKDFAYFNLYNAEEKIKNKNYKRAVFYSLEALKYDLKLKDRYYAKLILVESYIKLGEYDKASIYIDRLYYSKTMPKYAGYHTYLVKLSIEVGRVDLGKKEITKYIEAGNIPNNEQLWRWSHISYDLKDVKYAYELAASLSLNTKNLKWQVDLLIKLNRYNTASKEMELLYTIEKTKENKKRLVFLYELVGEKEKIAALHVEKLQSKCNEYSLFYLLDYYKLDKVNQKKLILKAYPYMCVKPTKQVELDFNLISFLENKENDKVKLYVDKLTTRVAVKTDDYLKISNIYNKLKECDNSIKYAQKYLDKYPNNVNALKNVGYCYDKKDKKGLAAYYLSAANVENPEDLELSKNLGYIYIDLKKPREALKYFESYLSENKDSRLNLSISLIYFDLKMYDKAKSNVNIYEAYNLEKPYEYYVLKAKLANLDKECTKSSHYYEKALSFKQEEYLNYEYINLLKSCDENKKSLVLVKELSKKYPNNQEYKKSLVYGYLEESKYEEAIDNAESAVFDEKWLYNVRSENKYVNKNFDVYFAETIRLDNYDSNEKSSPIHNASYVGGGVLQVGYRPDELYNYIAIFGEIVHTNKGNFNDTLQPSIGVKYKPSLDYDISISIQRMFDTAKDTIADTFVRVSAGFFDGYEYSLNEGSYFYHSLYLDAGKYIEDDSSILYANYDLGKIYKINSRFSFLPYLTTGATMNDAADTSITKCDVGLGISILNWSLDSKYKSYQVTSRLKLEARSAYSGNAKDDNTIRLQFEVMY